MTRYTYSCECGSTWVVQMARADYKSAVTCPCGKLANRDLAADLKTVEFDTAGCRDHNYIPDQKRVPGSAGFGKSLTAAGAAKRERAYAQDLQNKRALVRAGGNRGSIRMERSIPAELVHGKVRETGDANYWNDKKNVQRHKEWDL